MLYLFLNLTTLDIDNLYSHISSNIILLSIKHYLGRGSGGGKRHNDYRNLMDKSHWDPLLNYKHTRLSWLRVTNYTNYDHHYRFYHHQYQLPHYGQKVAVWCGVNKLIILRKKKLC